jgi:protein involved in polysaccharide export with SLBB domain
VQVLGAVKSGLYPMDATMTIADALAMAGGVTGGNVKKINCSGRAEARVIWAAHASLIPDPVGDSYSSERSWLARNPCFAGAARPSSA